MIALIVIGVAAALIWQNYANAPTDDNTTSQQEEPTPADPNDTEQYVGMTEEDALRCAKENNKTARVIERDGDAVPSTMDLRAGRLNFSVEDGIVTGVEEEAPNLRSQDAE